MGNKEYTASLLLDRLGIGVSAICVIHCLSIPVLVSILPLWPVHGVLQEWVHPILMIPLLPIVYFAARRSHFDRQITTLLLTGTLFVLAGWLLGHYWLGFWVETVLTIIGSGLLISGHWRNYRHHQRCTNSRHHHHPVAEAATESIGNKRGEER